MASNTLKFASKVIFLSSDPLLLPKQSSDPVSGMVAGDVYYNTTDNVIKYYNGTSWQNVSSSTVSLTGQTLNAANILVGNGSNQSAAVDTSAVGDILADSTNGLTIKSGAIVNADINASAAIALSKLAALTADRALVSNGSGVISAATTTATEIGYVNGVTSSIQNQLDDKLANTTDTLTGDLTVTSSVLTPVLDRANAGTLSVGATNATTLNLGTSASTTTINIGTGAGATTINLGGAGDTVNVAGTLAYVNTTNLEVTDKLITVNKGGAASSGDDSGVEVEEDGSITGYAKTANSAASWDLKAPASSGTIRLTPGSGAFRTELLSTASANRTLTLPNASDTLVGRATTDTLTNKTIDAANNTISNIANANISSSAAIAYSKLNLTGSIVNADVATGADIARNKLADGTAFRVVINDTDGVLSDAAAITAARALISDSNGIPTHSSVTSTELGYVSGVTSAIQTQLNAKASTALSNLASVAINASLVAGSDDSIDLGSDAAEWSTLWIKNISHNSSGTPNLTVQTTGNNGSLIMKAHGTGTLDQQVTKRRLSEGATSSNFIEEQYLDALSLSANTSSPTAISSLSFAHATYTGAILEYTITEATSGKVRNGRMMISTDGTLVGHSDMYSETAALGASAGLTLEAAVNGSNVEIRYNNTHATNAATMRVMVKRFRA